jgi:hypothetical protein
MTSRSYVKPTSQRPSQDTRQHLLAPSPIRKSSRIIHIRYRTCAIGSEQSAAKGADLSRLPDISRRVPASRAPAPVENEQIDLHRLNVADHANRQSAPPDWLGRFPCFSLDAAVYEASCGLEGAILPESRFETI